MAKGYDERGSLYKIFFRDPGKDVKSKQKTTGQQYANITPLHHEGCNLDATEELTEQQQTANHTESTECL